LPAANNWTEGSSRLASFVFVESESCADASGEFRIKLPDADLPLSAPRLFNATKVDCAFRLFCRDIDPARHFGPLLERCRARFRVIFALILRTLPANN
jgi:hypothetical protein